MKIYFKILKDGFIVSKETTKESIITDIVSASVMILLFALDALFSIFISHSWILDLLVVIAFISYLNSSIGPKIKNLTKDELVKEINDLYDDKNIR